MGDFPSAREHALYDVRRKRASVATTAVLIVSIAALILAGDPELSVLGAAAVLAQFAVPNWVGVEPRFPVPSMLAAVIEHVFGFVVPMVGVLLLYFVLNKGDFNFLGMVPIAVLGALIYSVYRWRLLGVSLARVRGASVPMSLGERLWRHYLGYAAGLTAGAVAVIVAGAGQNWLMAAGAYGGAFMIAKALVDLSLPQPPLEAERLSDTAAQLAAMSPVWFGLPWGVALTGLMATAETEKPFVVAVADDAITILYVAIATFVVFTAIAAVAFVMELVAGEG